MSATATPVQAPEDYLLHLADNAIVLGQRNAEWCGHGPPRFRMHCRSERHHHQRGDAALRMPRGHDPRITDH